MEKIQLTEKELNQVVEKAVLKKVCNTVIRESKDGWKITNKEGCYKTKEDAEKAVKKYLGDEK